MADVRVVAYAYLNRRERTVAEVRARLEKVVEKGDCTSEESEAAVAELLEFGYLDDARYARLFVEDKRNLESWGSERIQRALVQRGVEREVITAALGTTQGAGTAGRSGPLAGTAQTADATSELDRALGLLRRRGAPPGDEDPRERERAFGMLVRKGYESEVAGDAVRAWLRG